MSAAFTVGTSSSANFDSTLSKWLSTATCSSLNLTLEGVSLRAKPGRRSNEGRYIDSNHSGRSERSHAVAYKATNSNAKPAKIFLTILSAARSVITFSSKSTCLACYFEYISSVCPAFIILPRIPFHWRSCSTVTWYRLAIEPRTSPLRTL